MAMSCIRKTTIVKSTENTLLENCSQKWKKMKLKTLARTREKNVMQRDLRRKWKKPNKWIDLCWSTAEVNPLVWLLHFFLVYSWKFLHKTFLDSDTSCNKNASPLQFPFTFYNFFTLLEWPKTLQILIQ